MTTSAARLGSWLYSQPYILLSTTATAWGGNIVIGRVAAGHIPPLALAQTRWIGAFVILALIFWPKVRQDLPVIRRHLPILLLLSFFGITLYNSLAYVGLQYTQAINGALMQSTAPFWIALWSLLLFGDRLTWGQIGGILLSSIGVLAIITDGDPSRLRELTVNPGDLFLIAAMACYALYASVLRKRPPIHPMSFLVITIGLGGLMLMPATAMEFASGFVMQADTQTILSLIYVILIATILAYICFNRGVELIGPNRAGPFFHLIPVVASLLAIVFLGEAFRAYHAIGYALILSGIVLAQRFSR
ncbi:drug/metabolite transporter (DMT)-like permease [Breoghania corrubedonensis]|uniref:Drug/metabolite transporter (DMT)-like permease n=1 Tax=Breoghania corrubedonensis TaxID=665038 RepID=A0A2T5V7J9_9HYPH|nr:DMT family transporter [Breoghania corrubedonensis]PTW59706.1 drug/metabolite transporter (DMT)-like permease [Breoghania corrubedonensis]